MNTATKTVYMNHISLFSGYEGFGLGLKLAGIPIRTVAYCEYDSYCQDIIRARVRDGLLDDAPIWPDVRTFDGSPFNGKVGIITGGFPCQPHSVAGQRQGAEDERNLWPDTLRIIGEVGPDYVLLENVPGILVEFAGTVIGELASIGYDAEWGVVSAADVGANHLRKRWWALAYPNGNRCTGRGRASEQERQHDHVGWGEQPWADGEDGEVAHAQSKQGGRVFQRGFQTDIGTGGEQPWADGEDVEVAQPIRQSRLEASAPSDPQRIQWDSWDNAGGSGGTCQPRTGWWEVEPDVGRVVDGCPHRVDRLKALGNGIVPAVVTEFLKQVMRGSRCNKDE